MNRNQKKGVVFGAFVAVVIGAFGLAACDKQNDQRGKGDAPVAGRSGDDSPAFCTNMPDEFSNVCTKCLYGFPGYAVASTTHGGGVAEIKVFTAPQCGHVTATEPSPTPDPTLNAAVR